MFEVWHGKEITSIFNYCRVVEERVLMDHNIIKGNLDLNLSKASKSVTKRSWLIIYFSGVDHMFLKEFYQNQR